MSADTRPGKRPIVDQGGIRGPDGRLENAKHVGPRVPEPHGGVVVFLVPHDGDTKSQPAETSAPTREP